MIYEYISGYAAEMFALGGIRLFVVISIPGLVGLWFKVKIGACQ